MAKRVCSNGHVVRDKKATYCPQCGAELPPLPPPRKKWPILVGILAGILAMLLLCVIIAITTGNKEKKPESASAIEFTTALAATEKPTKSTAPMPTSTLKPIADISYAEIKEKRNSLTDAQWDAYVVAITGQRVEWTGYVEEISKNGRVNITLRSPKGWSAGSVSFYLPKGDVLRYNKDQKLTIQGDIRSIWTFLGSLSSVTLEDIVIIE